MTITLILTTWFAAGVLSAAFLSKVFTMNRAREMAQRR